MNLSRVNNRRMAALVATPLLAASALAFTALSSTPATAAVQSATLWDSADAPQVAVESDFSPVSVGTAFRSSVSGVVTAIELWRGSELAGDTRVFLYASNGALLGSGTLPKPASFSPGWRTVELDAPVAIAPNTLYVAAYFADNGRYAVDEDYFCAGGPASAAPPLYPELDTSCSNSAGNNGVYAYGATPTVPTQSYRASNYWVGPVVEFDAVAPQAPTGLTTYAGNGAVSLSWAPSQGATSYDVYYATSISGPYTHAATNIADNEYAVSGLANGTTYYFAVTARNAGGESDLSSVVPAAPVDTVYRHYEPTPVSATLESGTSDVNLGVKFRADVPASLTGVRFWRAPGAGMESNRVFVFDAAGNQIASSVLVGEGGAQTGWVTVDIYPPVALEPDAQYTVSYFANGGRYSYTTAHWPRHSGLLVSLVGSGVYAYGSVGSWPTQSWNDAGYFVTPVVQIGTPNYNINED